jgi:two-component system response regulator YesN
MGASCDGARGSNVDDDYMDKPAIGTLIVDDQDDVRLLLRLIIESANNGLIVAGEATGGRDALELLDALDPMVVVLDQMMPGMDGIECAVLIRARRPHQVILICTAHLDAELQERALAAGVRGVVPKSRMADLPELIREAIAV